MAAPAAFSRYYSSIESELASLLSSFKLPLYEILRYHLGWVDRTGQPDQGPHGKLLRPCFCLAACEAVGGDWTAALPAAASLELIHNFSLIHDDIEDRSSQRHHRDTVWKVWGLAQGLNAGDAMHCLSQLAMFRLRDTGNLPGRIVESLHLLDGACLALCEGQYLDLDYEKRPAVSVDDYLRMISLKTAALFRCSFELGAVLGRGSKKITRGVTAFGDELGMSFQVRDDYLGIWGQNTGKSTQSDIVEKKKSFPIVYALNNAAEADRRMLIEVNSRETLTENDVARVLAILERCHAKRRTEELCRYHYQKAVAGLNSVSLSDKAKQPLIDIADYLVSRQY